MIQVSHLSYRIGRKELLSDISLEAQAGAFTAIIGANGAGKSTLLKILCRDYPLQQGHVYFHGKPLQNFSVAELSRIRAVLSQQQQLSLPFVCEELVLMGRYPHFNGHPTQTDHQIVAFAMQQAGVAHLKGRIYQTLSGGEQQRVQLARVLAQITDLSEIQAPQTPIATPKYLFLDEPITGLDLSHQYHTLDLARQKAENPKVRIRKAAKQLGVSEAELVACGIGQTAIRLEGDFREMLKDVPSLGYVMALTRNDHVVHERKGVYEQVSFDNHVGLVLGEDIDLRLFMTH
jgi:iron complex transport system ATP-binding protein